MNSSKPTQILTKLKQIKIETLKQWSKNFIFLPRKYSKFTIPIPKVLRIPHVSQDTRRYTVPPGSPGAGAGKGGGAGGSVKEGGGGLGRFAAAQEEGYFFLKDKEQLEKLKKTLKPAQKADPKNDDGKN